MAALLVSWMERRALRGSGRLAGLTAGHLCRRYRRKTYPYVSSVARLMCQAADERVAAQAHSTLAQAWDNPLARGAIWYALRGVTRAGAEGKADRRDVPDLPYQATLFLLEPAPGCRFAPGVRLVAALVGPGDGGRRIRDDGLLYGARAVVAAAVDSIDPRTRQALEELLRTTDHPGLLDELERAFRDALDSELRGRSHALWEDEGQPTALLRILLDNPHVCRPPDVLVMYQERTSAVLALLKGRFDLLDRYDECGLVRVLLGSAAAPLPSDVVDACRRVLRGLGPGDGRELVCVEAMDGDAEARAAAVDGGYLPGEPARVPLFLFCTEQWEAYDRLDPHGRKLREYHRSYTDADWHRLHEVADRTGRTCPPRPRPHPPATPKPSAPNRYRPGGFGTSGTGGYSTGGFSVHGA